MLLKCCLSRERGRDAYVEVRNDYNSSGYIWDKVKNVKPSV
jgi:hypothetical protein